MIFIGEKWCKRQKILIKFRSFAFNFCYNAQTVHQSKICTTKTAPKIEKYVKKVGV